MICPMCRKKEIEVEGHTICLSCEKINDDVETERYFCDYDDEDEENEEEY